MTRGLLSPGGDNLTRGLLSPEGDNFTHLEGKVTRGLLSAGG